MKTMSKDCEDNVPLGDYVRDALFETSLINLNVTANNIKEDYTDIEQKKVMNILSNQPPL